MDRLNTRVTRIINSDSKTKFASRGVLFFLFWRPNKKDESIGIGPSNGPGARSTIMRYNYYAFASVPRTLAPARLACLDDVHACPIENGRARNGYSPKALLLFIDNVVYISWGGGGGVIAQLPKEFIMAVVGARTVRDRRKRIRRRFPIYPYPWGPSMVPGA